MVGEKLSAVIFESIYKSLKTLAGTQILLMKVESTERAIAEVNGSLVSGVQLKVCFSFLGILDIDPVFLMYTS